MTVIPPFETVTPFIILHRARRPAPVDFQKPGRDWMFQCQHCGTVTPPRVSAETLVVETRARVYPFREKVAEIICLRHRTPKLETRDDPGGTGREIVREIRVCLPCKRTLQPSQTVPTP